MVSDGFGSAMAVAYVSRCCGVYRVVYIYMYWWCFRYVHGVFASEVLTLKNDPIGIETK